MIKIEEREVLIDTAWVVFQSENIIIIDISTTTKYPQVGPYSSHTIHLYASGPSIHKGSDPRPTTIELDLPDGWSAHPTTYGRYEVRIYCVDEKALSSENAKLVWEKRRVLP